MSTSSSSPPLQVSSPAQTNNTSTNTTTVASKAATMPLISTSSASTLLTGSNNSTSSTNSTKNSSNSILNNTVTGKSNLLANHLNNKNSNTILTEQSNGNGSQNFCLKWSQHTSNLIKNLTEMVLDQQIVDVTLACDGSSIKAHKIVLSACSNYFKELFLANPCKHPIVILKDIKINEMRAIVDFMYRGEVNVSQNQLSSLLKTAEILRVKGLTNNETAEFRSAAEKVVPIIDNNTEILDKLTGLDSAVAAVAALNGKLLNNGQSNLYDSLQSNDSVDNTDQLYNNNLLNLASLSSLRMNSLGDHLNNLNNMNNINNMNSLNNSTNNILNLRESAQSEMLKRKKKRKRLNSYLYASNKSSLSNSNNQDTDQAISLVTSNKDTSENNENSSNSCNSSNNSTDNSAINNSLRNLRYIKKEAQLAVEQGNESDCGSVDESNDLKRTKDLLNVIAAAGGFNQGTGSASVVANFYGRSSTPESSNQNLLAIRRKLMQQQFNTLSPKTAQDVPDNSDNSNWLQSRQIVEASLIEPYEDNEEEMIDVRPIVSFDEGSMPASTDRDQMVVMNSLDINSMTSNTSNTQSGKICICQLCHLTFTAYSSLRRHMQRHYADRERYECDICKKSYSRKDYLKEHRKLKHSNSLVPNVVAS